MSVLQVLSRALMFIPQLGKYAESILENGSSSGRKLAKLQAIGRQAVAALCALGGFKETIKIGSEVQVSSYIKDTTHYYCIYLSRWCDQSIETTEKINYCHFFIVLPLLCRW